MLVCLFCLVIFFWGGGNSTPLNAQTSTFAHHCHRGEGRGHRSSSFFLFVCYPCPEIGSVQLNGAAVFLSLLSHVVLLT